MRDAPRWSTWRPHVGWLLAALGWSMAIAWGCLQEAGTSTAGWWSLPLPYKDKIAHAGIHALLAWLLWRGLVTSGHVRDRAAWTAAIVAWCTVFGLLIEWGQWQFTLTRSAEALDALANTLGAVLGSALALRQRSPA